MTKGSTTKLPTPADVTARLVAQRPGKIHRATAALLARIAHELETLERSPSCTTADDDIELNFNLLEDERNPETVKAVTEALLEAGWSVEMLSDETMCVWSEVAE
jgi:hypothetical protein